MTQGRFLPDVKGGDVPRLMISMDGDFTDDEAVAIIQRMRDVEQARPEMDVHCSLATDSVERAQGILDRIKPPFAHRAAIVTVSRPKPRPPFSKN